MYIRDSTGLPVAADQRPSYEPNRRSPQLLSGELFGMFPPVPFLIKYSII